MTSNYCYCGNSTPYAQCCEVLHLGTEKAETAEQLMRSRFSAFCTRDIDYLLKTLHRSQHSDTERTDLARSINNTQWLSLRIIKSSPSTVEFVAFYKAEPLGQLHELSNFVFENGSWFYTEGKHLTPVKIGRNDLCYCGSGKKFKKCCA